MTLVLLGESTGTVITETCKRLKWGRMWVHRKINIYEGEKWGFDNGAFGDWDKVNAMVFFDLDSYRRRLDRAYSVGVPFLAVVPDLIANEKSLDFSLECLEMMPKEWPNYLAVQDGMTTASVEGVLAKFAGIFVGGSTRFKSTLPEWTTLAHRHGKRVHYARCSGPRRLERAMALGVDSVDSSQPLWSRELLRKYVFAFEHPTQCMGV